jgi:hypothetical protein
MTGPLDETPREELDDLDRRIRETTESIQELRDSLASDNAVMDAPERSAVLNNIEELEGVLDGLTRRRETVQQETES